jgi:antitoxin ParD1/3/4
MAKNTSISLGPHFEKFIEKQLKSGRYSTASEVVRESLRLMEEQEKNKAALRKAIVAGEKSGIAGPIDLENIKKAGRAAANGNRKSA